MQYPFEINMAAMQDQSKATWNGTGNEITSANASP